MWKKDWNEDGTPDPLDWTRERSRIGIAIKNQDGCPVSGIPAAWENCNPEDQVPWGGENPEEWYPMDLRFTVVVVEKGNSFSGWENYP